MPSEVKSGLRFPFMGLCALAANAANAQSSWLHELQVPGRMVRITDATESSDGIVLVATLHVLNTFDMQGPGMVQKLDNAGSLITSRGIWSDSLTSPFKVIPNAVNSTIDILGDYGMNGEYGGFWVRLDNELYAIDSMLYPIPDAVGASLDNGMRATNGDMILPVFFSVVLDNPHSSLLVLRLGPEGDSISSARFDTSWILAARDVAETSNGHYILGCVGAPVLPDFDVGFVSYMKFDTALTYSGGYSGPRIDGSNSIANFQNTLHDHQSFVVLEDGQLLVGGKTGSLSSGHKGAILKMTEQGEWLGSIILDTPFQNDHPAILRNLTRDPDGNLLFAMIANFEPGPPSPFQPEEPSRVHVYKLDTALNVLCTNVIDGFAENAYYFVDRIIATDDGGYLTVGSRVDLSDPERPWVGWARKFGPDDCFTGLNEEAGAPQVLIAPNPGRDELRIVLNGSHRNASVALHNLNGHLVATKPLRLGHARFDTSALASGVYAYIVSDAVGRRIASGRWVKE